MNLNGEDEGEFVVESCSRIMLEVTANFEVALHRPTPNPYIPIYT